MILEIDKARAPSPQERFVENKKKPGTTGAQHLQGMPETQMSCDAPASGAVSGLSTLLMVTVDHEFFITARSGQTQPIPRSR